jgi:hypothetical protein
VAQKVGTQNLAGIIRQSASSADIKNQVTATGQVNALNATASNSQKPPPRCLTKKAEPPPTRDVNRDSGTDSANGGWLRRLVRHQRREIHNKIRQIKTLTNRKRRTCSPHQTGAS